MTKLINIEGIEWERRRILLALKQLQVDKAQYDYLLRIGKAFDQTQSYVTRKISVDYGKYSMAVFYLLDPMDNSGALDFEPHHFLSCPFCSGKHPLLIWYEQTEDSLGGDIWELRVFYICNNIVFDILRKTENHRFLKLG